jgi:hypothetical protein
VNGNCEFVCPGGQTCNDKGICNSSWLDKARNSLGNYLQDIKTVVNGIKEKAGEAAEDVKNWFSPPK